MGKLHPPATASMSRHPIHDVFVPLPMVCFTLTRTDHIAPTVAGEQATQIQSVMRAAVTGPDGGLASGEPSIITLTLVLWSAMLQIMV